MQISDYFRGLLTETLNDFGKTDSSEATITSLKLEIETLKHDHNIELNEMKKNITTILKDIQKTVIEDREKIMNEMKIKYEQDAVKRVDDAKSKQWYFNFFFEVSNI